MTCMSNACRSQKRASDHLDLEFQMVMSHCVGAGNQTQVLGKSSQCMELLLHTISLAPCGSCLHLSHCNWDHTLDQCDSPQKPPHVISFR